MIGRARGDLALGPPGYTLPIYSLQSLQIRNQVQEVPASRSCADGEFGRAISAAISRGNGLCAIDARERSPCNTMRILSSGLNLRRVLRLISRTAFSTAPLSSCFWPGIFVPFSPLFFYDEPAVGW